MKVLWVPLFTAALLVWAAPAPAQTDCEAARCAVQRALDESCACDTATTHGRYVSCVAHVVKRLSDAGTIPITCRGKVVRCAARSTCGKTGFVACRIPTDTCDPVTLTCGADPTVACTTDLDCGAVCRTKRSAELCLERGGVPGAGSCCATCATTP